MFVVAIITVGITNIIKNIRDDQKKRRAGFQDGRVGPVDNFPFGFMVQLPWYRKIQVAVATLTLLPLKVFFAGTTLPLSLFLANVVVYTSGKTEEGTNYDRPFQRVIIRLLILLSRVQIFLFGISVKNIGNPEPRERAPLVVLAPHSTIIDGVFLLSHASITGMLPSPISRAQNKDMFIVGALMGVCNPIYVSRERKDSRSSTIDSIKNRADISKPYSQLMIFPEGTNTNRRSLIKFKPGAFIPGCPIQPVLVRLDGWDTMTLTFDGPNLTKLIFLSLCQFQIKIVFEYLPLYQPNDEEMIKPALYAENVRQIMGDGLGIPLCDLAYENGLLLEECMSLGLPSSTVEVNAATLARVTGFKVPELKLRLAEFALLRNEDTNMISEESVEKRFEEVHKDELEKIQNLLKLHNGQLDFFQYTRNHFLSQSKLENQPQWRRRVSSTCIEE